MDGEIEMQDVYLDANIALLQSLIVSGQNNQLVKDTIIKHSYLLENRNEMNQTLLHEASEVGNDDLVTFLLGVGSYPGSRDNNEFTPLITGARQGHLKVVEAICSENSIEQTDVNGWSALMWACYKGNVEVVQHLISQGADLNLVVNYNMSCLLWASGRGFTDIVKLLCLKKAKVNHVDKFGNSALIWASRRGYHEIISILISSNANPNLVGANGCNALINCIKGYHQESVESLLASPHINVNLIDRDGHTPLMFASKLGYDVIITKLLGHGAYLNSTDNHGDTALVKAVKNGHQGAVKILLARYADVDIRNKENNSALHIACEQSNVAAVTELLKCDPKLEAANRNGESPLLIAVKRGAVDICRLLIDKGANVAATDSNKNTSLHFAMKSQNFRLVEMLLCSPENVRLLYQTNNTGESPYTIDESNGKVVLTHLYGSKLLTTNRIQDHRFERCSGAIAAMMAEPSFETPFCVGLYSKWEDSVNSIVDEIKRYVSYFSTPHSPPPKKVSWILVTIICLSSLFVGTFCAFITDERTVAGVVSSLSLFFASLFFMVLVHFGSKSKKKGRDWSKTWRKILDQKIENLHNFFSLIFLQHFETKNNQRVRFVFADCLEIENLKKDTILREIVKRMAESLEKEFGWFFFRVARVFEMSESPASKFRSVCCVPTFIFFILFVLDTMAIVLTVVALYGPSPLTSDPATFNVLLITLGGANGLIVVATLPFAVKVANSLRGQAQGHDQIALKTEVNAQVRALELLDTIYSTQTRVCVVLNALDPSFTQVLLTSVKAALSVNSVVCVVCIDHVAMAENTGNTAVSIEDFTYSEGGIGQNIVQLPVFVSTIQQRKSKKKGLRRMETAGIEPSSPERTNETTSPFSLIKWLSKCSCYQLITHHSIRRIDSVMTLTAHMLRADNILFTWRNLSTWVVMTDLWPYKTTCLISYCEKKQIDRKKHLKAVYFDICNRLSSHQLFDSADQESFQGFLTSSHCDLTVHDLFTFTHYTITLDPKLKHFVPNFKQGNSDYSLSSNLSDDVAVFDWSIEDVCYRLKALPGLNMCNLPRYENFIRRNNFHGLALVSCDLSELKREIGAAFGDWCLIKKFILESKAVAKGSRSAMTSQLQSPMTSQFGFARSPPNSPVMSQMESDSRSDDFVSEEGNTPFLSGLPRNEQYAYNEAFKEYLQLNPGAVTSKLTLNRATTNFDPKVNFASANANNARTMADNNGNKEVLDNEVSPLLNGSDINANT